MATTRRDHAAAGAAVTSAGATTAGLGLVGGGVPGFKSDSDTIKNVRHGSWRQRTGAAFSSGRGGVFGYRADAHQGFLNRQLADEKGHGGKPTSRVNHYLRGQGTGKIKPEVDIIRDMKRGRAASTVALAGGAAATAYGRHLSKTPVKKSQRDVDAYHGALLGGGSAGAGVAYGAQRTLNAQSNKWSARSAAKRDEAAKIIPKLRDKSGAEVGNNPRLLAGKSKVQAEAAGRLRGDATQAQYFSRVYRNSARMARSGRNTALGVAAVGGGGLLLSHKKDGVRKSRVSAFGVEH